MAYRGRLIFPILVDLYPLNVPGTAADPDGAGPLTSGYDPIFREPRKLSSGDRLGTSARVESAPLQLRVQVEPSMLNKLQQGQAGDKNTGLIVVVMHFLDLEAAGLVDGTTGEALIKKGDRVGAFRDLAGNLIQTVRTPPGLYVVEAQPLFGLGSQRNLLQVTLESRNAG